MVNAATCAIYGAVLFIGAVGRLAVATVEGQISALLLLSVAAAIAGLFMVLRANRLPRRRLR